MENILAINCSKENNSLLSELHKLASMKHRLNPQPSRVTIARNIRSLREAAQLSQLALAKKAGVSQRTVSNIENPESETTPTTDRVDAVAAVFGLQLFHVAMPVPLDILVDIGGLNRVIDTYATVEPAKRVTVEQIAQLALPSPAK